MSKKLTRYLEPFIRKDLKMKMVFLAGPRQVGKTTLATNLIKNYRDNHPAYLNWDNLEHKRKILNRDWPQCEKLIVLDEIHKYKNWKNLVKGFYDTLKHTHTFLITGSARLDTYRKSGDSLLGRYFYYRLHPLSLPELKYEKNALKNLLRFGGFPESYFSKNEQNHKRWQNLRLHQIINIDLRELAHVSDITKLELLAESLQTKVGSPLSIASISRDFEIDFKTTKRWIQLLDMLYFCYLIPPYGPPKVRAVKKEQKLYLWDWSQVEDEGSRFENMVASHLLKYCHYFEDTKGEKLELRFLRDTDGREIDFVVLKNKAPLFALECKIKEKEISPHIHYFQKRTNIPKFYQVHLGTSYRQVSNQISVLPFEAFCKEVSLV